MATIERRYSKDDLARLGEAIYESGLAKILEPTAQGKLVAIDVDSGDYDVDLDELAACDRLLARRPNAQVWLMRVGSRYVRRFRHYSFLQMASAISRVPTAVGSLRSAFRS
jgi:hypothetical protein